MEMRLRFRESGLLLRQVLKILRICYRNNWSKWSQHCLTPPWYTFGCEIFVGRALQSFYQCHYQMILIFTASPHETGEFLPEKVCLKMLGLIAANCCCHAGGGISYGLWTRDDTTRSVCFTMWSCQEDGPRRCL